MCRVAAVFVVAGLVAGAGGCASAEGGRAADRAAGAPAETTSTTAEPATTSTATPTTTIAACPPVAGVAGDVDVFRSTEGGDCLSPGRLVAYRCDDGSVPAVVVDLAGTPTDHLGGRFAVTVPSVPDDAELLGVRDDGARLLRSPSDPAAVYLDTGMAVTRWPALPRWTTSSGAVVEGFYRPAAFFLGDSVMLGAVGAIRTAMAPWDVVVDAQENRSTLAGAEVIRQRRSEIHDVVVVQLGTNDGADPGIFAGRIRSVMDELVDVPLVVWLTTREVRPYYAGANATLRQVVGSYPNGVVADWNAVAPPSGEYTDGLHLKPEGAAALAELARDTVLGWYAGTVDRGPDACRGALDAAVHARR